MTFAESSLVQEEGKEYVAACFVDRLMKRIEGVEVACVIRGRKGLCVAADHSIMAREQRKARICDLSWELGSITAKELEKYKGELGRHIKILGHIDDFTREYLSTELAKATTFEGLKSIEDMIAKSIPSVPDPEQPLIVAELFSELLEAKQKVASLQLGLTHLRIEADKANQEGDVDTVMKKIGEIDECEELLKTEVIHTKTVYANLVESM